jgi:serine phosphatase RsbU (regulator of sigma subunit)
LGYSWLDAPSELTPSAQLTLVTDGVIEARSAAGELFGFDRMAVLSAQSAGQIADTARQFGQDDNITVLTLARTD